MLGPIKSEHHAGPHESTRAKSSLLSSPTWSGATAQNRQAAVVAAVARPNAYPDLAPPPPGLPVVAPTDDPADWLFLEAVIFHAVGMGEGEAVELRRLISEVCPCMIFISYQIASILWAG